MKVSEILKWMDQEGRQCVFIGNPECEIDGFSSLREYKCDTLTWIKKSKNYDAYLKSGGSRGQIACAIVEDGVETDLSCVITVKNSKELFFSVLHEFWGRKPSIGTVGKGTVISGNTQIDSTATIGCNCSIVGNISIGKQTVIEHNVVIQGNVRIGSRCYIQSGAVIGIDGYGYSMYAGTKKKKMVEHFGGVRVGNDVFIGSHVNIARGTIDDTTIGNGVKIAPTTHIGHNNIIGEDTAIICSAMYGSVVTGKRSYITASVVANQITIGDDVVVGMGSVVTKPIKDDVVAYGIPATEKRKNNSKM